VTNVGPAPHKKFQITESILQQVCGKDSWPGVADHRTQILVHLHTISSQVKAKNGSPSGRSKGEGGCEDAT